MADGWNGRVDAWLDECVVNDSVETNVWIHWINGNGESGVVPLRIRFGIIWIIITAEVLSASDAHHSENNQHDDESNADNHDNSNANPWTTLTKTMRQSLNNVSISRQQIIYSQLTTYSC